jgi:diaminopimelate decarboxylase
LPNNTQAVGARCRVGEHPTPQRINVERTRQDVDDDVSLVGRYCSSGDGITNLYKSRRPNLLRVTEHRLFD